MKEIKQFLEDFFKSEVEARKFSMIENRALAKRAVNKFYSYCIPDLYNMFGVVFNEEELFDFESEPSRYSHPRYIYKISLYENKNYGSVYVAYVSGFHFNKRLAGFYEMAEFFVLTEINNELKIIKSGAIDLDNRPNWIDEHGAKDISIHSLGKFVSAKRYIEPKDDEDSMKKYLAAE